VVALIASGALAGGRARARARFSMRKAIAWAARRACPRRFRLAPIAGVMTTDADGASASCAACRP